MFLITDLTAVLPYGSNVTSTTALVQNGVLTLFGAVLSVRSFPDGMGVLRPFIFPLNSCIRKELRNNSLQS